MIKSPDLLLFASESIGNLPFELCGVVLCITMTTSLEEKKAAAVDVGTSADTHDVGTGEVDAIEQKYGSVKRGLSGRHVQLMAIGGSIGTGIFVGIGSSLRTAGPLSCVLAYIIYSCMFIWPCNMAVAEMATHLPIRGSVFEFASRYVDPAFGFAMGWTYFYGAAMLYCAELSAVATVIEYWNSEINAAAWIAMAIAVCLMLNLFAVKYVASLRTTRRRLLTCLSHPPKLANNVPSLDGMANPNSASPVRSSFCLSA